MTRDEIEVILDAKLILSDVELEDIEHERITIKLFSLAKVFTGYRIYCLEDHDQDLSEFAVPSNELCSSVFAQIAPRLGEWWVSFFDKHEAYIDPSGKGIPISANTTVPDGATIIDHFKSFDETAIVSEELI